jgi:hypothetical protein
MQGRQNLHLPSPMKSNPENPLKITKIPQLTALPKNTTKTPKIPTITKKTNNHQKSTTKIQTFRSENSKKHKEI